MAKPGNRLENELAHLIMVGIFLGFVASVVAIVQVKLYAAKTYREEGLKALIRLVLKSTLLMVFGSAVGAGLTPQEGKIFLFGGLIETLVSSAIWIAAAGFAAATVLSILAGSGAKLVLERVGLTPIAGPVSSLILAAAYSVFALLYSNPNLLDGAVTTVIITFPENFFGDVAEFAHFLSNLAQGTARDGPAYTIAMLILIFFEANGNQFVLVEYWPGVFVILAAIGFALIPITTPEPRD